MGREGVSSDKNLPLVESITNFQVRRKKHRRVDVLALALRPKASATCLSDQSVNCLFYPLFIVG